MAKKVRTPPPPRRVQAPQRRDTKGAAGQRSPWVYAAAGAGTVVLVAIVVGTLVLRSNGGGTGVETQKTSSNINALPGIRRTKAPWSQEYEFLADRLLPLGLSQLSAEQLAFHIHMHLDIVVNGKSVPVPAQIGINPGAQYLTELHTHAPNGVIHNESAKDKGYTLGELFGEWGVYLNSLCVGAYCNNLNWYVDGKRQVGSPQDLVLKSHQEIAIVVGKPPQKVPSTYKFAPGE